VQPFVTDVAARTEPGQDTLATPPAVAPPSRGRRPRLPAWVGLVLGNPLAVIGCIVLATIVLGAICAPLLTSYDPTAMGLAAGLPPSPAHPFGANDHGQDIFAQALYGARFSLSVGFAAGLAVTALATLIGMTAGYLGGLLDDILGMVMNIFLVVPQLPLLIVLGAYTPFGQGNLLGTGLTMVFVIAITGWAWGGRVMRSQTLSLRQRDFVQAAVVAGESTPRIIFGEVLPNMISLIANTIISSTLGAILLEASLEFLGLGDSTNITWGTMLHNAQAGSVLFSGEWWVFVFPGLAIALTILSMILINNAVDAISNPRLRVVKGPRAVAGGASEVGAAGMADPEEAS
jgi:peptide/nickel transport system permease protein